MSLSGKVTSPRRSRGSIESRINKFVDDVCAIDQQYAPDPDTLTEYSYSIWIAELEKRAVEERHYLRPGKLIKLTTFESRLSMYRRAIKAMNVFNPKVFHYLRKLAIDNTPTIKSTYKFANAMKPVELYDATLKLLSRSRSKLSKSQQSQLQSMSSFIFHPMCEIFSLTSEERLKLYERDQQVTASLMDKRNHVKFPINKYIHWSESVLTNLEHHSVYEIGVAIIFVTGRMPIEVFKIGNFSSPKGNSIKFSGGSKVRSLSTPTYSIPTIFCGRKILRGFLHLRNSYYIDRTLSNSQVNKRLNDHLTSVLRGVLGDTFKVTTLCQAYAHYFTRDCSELDIDKRILSLFHFSNEYDYRTFLFYKAIYFDRRDTEQTARKFLSSLSSPLEQAAKLNDFRNDIVIHLRTFKGQFGGTKARVLDFLLDGFSNGTITNITQAALVKRGFNVPAIVDFFSAVGMLPLFTPSGSELNSWRNMASKIGWAESEPIIFY